MQMHRSEFRSVLTCARTVYRNEGFAAFYVSYPTTLAISIPFNAIQFTVYEQVKRVLNPRHEYSPSTHITAGAIAGAIAAAVTTPLDVAKTILQTKGSSQDAEIRGVKNMTGAFKIIWARDGLKGFTRGLSPRVLTTMPSTAICWLSYEFFSTFPPFSLDFVLMVFARGRHSHGLDCRLPCSSFFLLSTHPKPSYLFYALNCNVYRYCGMDLSTRIVSELDKEYNDDQSDRHVFTFNLLHQTAA